MFSVFTVLELVDVLTLLLLLVVACNKTDNDTSVEETKTEEVK